MPTITNTVLTVSDETGHPVELLVKISGPQPRWRTSNPLHGDPFVSTDDLMDEILELAEDDDTDLLQVGETGEQVSPLMAIRHDLVSDDEADELEEARMHAVEGALEAAEVGGLVFLRRGSDIIDAAVRTSNGWLSTTHACRTIADENVRAGERHRMR